MGNHNPYAPMKASLKAPAAGILQDGVWRDGDQVVVTHGASFPKRCVKCNAPAEAPSKVRRVYWHHPAIYLLFLAYAILYIIVAMILRKSMEIDPCLCEEHASKRRQWIWFGWIGSIFGLIGIPVIAAGAGLDMGPALLLAFVCFIGCAAAGSMNARILYAKRIDSEYARLKGADRRFLAGLPKFL
jgi:hypothetical protein